MSVSEKKISHPLLTLLEERMEQANFAEERNKMFKKLSSSFTYVSHISKFALNEEYLEWVDIAEAVSSATNRFVMFELGAGYGRWCVNAMIALKFLNPIPFHFVAVEAENTHFKFLKQYFLAHGLDLKEHRLLKAAVDIHNGHALFHMGDPNEWYGQCLDSRNFWDRLSHSCKNLYSNWRSDWTKKKRKESVKTLSLNSILLDYEQVDLIDLDIQGSELEVLASSIDLLNQKVKRLHIGTHSKDIEQGLEKLFHQHGWKNLHLYSLFNTYETPYGTIRFEDGVQSWVNSNIV